ncbi:MAG: GNAT family N-acetyltransferase [Oscillospiraceae bacterium]|nr:GNAT family N-acetyltransferase [Oscillospiraceae bacterium]
MKYEILPCSDDDSDLIDEKSDQIVRDHADIDEDTEEETFVYQATDQDGNLLGGCVLVTDELRTAHIYCLWVDEAHRRQGIATALFREAERKAADQGCYLSLIGTFDFQAKPFYDRLGYSLIVTTHDYPKGHEHYFMYKRLDRGIEEAVPSGYFPYVISVAKEEDAEELGEELAGRLREHDVACVPREHPYINISKKVTDENGNIIAGIVGGVDGWNGSEIESIWVDEAYRGQGIGSALVRAFEKDAKEHGVRQMIVEPYDWILEFFRKNDYETVTGVLEDLPKGHTMYCMDKPL